MIKRYLSIFFSAALALNVSAQTSKHVILVSIDGFRPDFYLDKNWPTPNLQQLVAKGSHAKGVRCIFPSVTYPSHTTLITGTFPNKHGITYNTMPDENRKYVWTTESKNIKSETLWQSVRKSGLTSASVSWPISVGAEIDYNLPEIWSTTNMADRKSAISKYATPKGLLEEMEQFAIGDVDMEDLNLSSLAMDENNSRMAAYIFRKYKPALLSIHIAGVDGAQHKNGRSGPEVSIAVASADHAVMNLMDAVKKAGLQESTTIIITGDHGFVDLEKTLSPNIWLTELGIDSKVGKEEPIAKFQASGGSAFFHLKDPKDKATLKKIRDKMSNLPKNIQEMYRIVERDELDKIGADPHASFALAASNGVYIQDASSGDLVKPRKGGAHGYFPDSKEIRTGFIITGAGVKPGVTLESINLEDVAPTVAKLLGISLVNADGKAVMQVLK